MGRFPKTRVESPWDGPEPALHLSRGGGAENAYHRAIRAQVKDPAQTHIIREVRVGYMRDFFSTPRPAKTLNEYPRSFIEDTIGRAEEQYRLLDKKYGIRIPDHEFAITTDNIGQMRTLARIAIIEGRSCAPRGMREMAFRLAPALVRADLTDTVEAYHHDVSTYESLADIHPGPGLNDFVHGAPRGLRGGEQTARQAYLVDLEPLFVSPQC